MYKYLSAAIRAFNADIGQDRLGIAALGKAGAGQKAAEPPVLIYHRRAAFVTDHIALLIFDDDLFDVVFRALQLFFEIGIKLFQNITPLLVTGLYAVQLVFHFSGKIHIDKFPKVSLVE